MPAWRWFQNLPKTWRPMRQRYPVCLATLQAEAVWPNLVLEFAGRCLARRRIGPNHQGLRGIPAFLQDILRHYLLPTRIAGWQNSESERSGWSTLGPRTARRVRRPRSNSARQRRRAPCHSEALSIRRRRERHWFPRLRSRRCQVAANPPPNANAENQFLVFRAG